jgi:choice-of-anchor B domain-containing protein
MPWPHSFPAFAVLSLLGSAAAQGVNVRMRAHVLRFPGATAPTSNYSGVWGMVVNGRELALVPARTGTLIYDCSNPDSPVEKGFIPGPGSTSMPYYWREANSYGSYAYISSEHGPLQIIDLTNPDAPTLVRTFGPRAHTVSVDVANARLWANGGSSPGGGSTIYDLADPRNPVSLTTYGSAYVHDCLPLRGYSYLAQINAGNFRILDTRSFPTLTTLSTTTTPGQFTHNVWVDDDDRVAVTADENRGGCMTVYDVTNKSVPVQLATWCSPAGGTVHNVFIKGQVAHFSSYTAGYYAVDLSDPSSPTLIGGYDTSTLAGSDYAGCFGAYPFQPSGVIYLSDMQTGFWIVEPTCGVPHHYGASTAGTNGVAPVLGYAGGFARVGAAGFRLVARRMLPGTPIALLLGSAPGAVSALGITVHIDLAQPHLLLSAGSDASGAFTLNLGIANAAYLAGRTLYAQVISADPAASQGLAASQGFRITICP